MATWLKPLAKPVDLAHLNSQFFGVSSIAWLTDGFALRRLCYINVRHVFYVCFDADVHL